jgi:hypothetical protein
MLRTGACTRAVSLTTAGAHLTTLFLVLDMMQVETGLSRIPGQLNGEKVDTSDLRLETLAEPCRMFP